ncbi:TetR family transcriptional regulator [Roseiarcus fermentans]|uniref:TetR family transcriptional regulator n=1 Tax=Roseiarcus fermentans TaxID=1473586 RepID=A0A366EPP6_9HYPH|nr:TetR/AcrR family transcriptional regulator [Roseiarcus fermentans]RBP03469.1 TetR family transcriptional regulator [Roseiarcus fermentans]
MAEDMRDDAAGGTRKEPIVRRNYHHGSVPSALHAAARQGLEAGGDPEQIGLRDLARKIGVSPTAAYRHFTNKEDLMASVAAEGFQELTEALKGAQHGPDPTVDIGLAYIEFALTQPGLFRLMFGPLLTERDKHETLRDSAAEAFAIVERLGCASGDSDAQRRAKAMVSYGALHGLANLSLMKILPEQEARSLALGVLEHVSRASQTDPSAPLDQPFPSDVALPATIKLSTVE